MEDRTSRVSPAEFEALVRREMGPAPEFEFAVEELTAGAARFRLRYHEGHLRPGRTISGPVMFTLADTALWALVMSVAGMVPLAVTSDMSIRFLRKPRPADLVAEARLLKPRGRLLVGEVTIFSDGEDEPVAHVTGTYAVPSTSGRAAEPAEG